jgi:O-antigen/teichoic acid export membrane protein
MKDQLFIIFGNILGALVGFSFTSIFSHLGNYADAAQYGFVLALISPIQTFLAMQHSYVLLTNKINFRQAFQIRLVLSILLCLIAFFLSIFYQNPLIFALGIYRFLDMIFEINLNNLIIENQKKYYFLYSLLRAVVSVGFIFLVFYLYKNIVISVFISALAVGIFDIFIVNRKNIKLIKINETIKNIKQYLPSTVYLGLSSLVTTINPFLPRYFMESKGEALQANLAALSGLTSITMGATILIHSTMQVYTRKMVSSDNILSKKYFDIGIRNVLLISLPIIALSHFLAPPVVSLILGKKYAFAESSLVYFTIYFIILALNYIINSAYIVTETYSNQLISNIISVLVSVIILFILLKANSLNLNTAIISICIGGFINTIYGFVFILTNKNNPKRIAL